MKKILSIMLMVVVLCATVLTLTACTQTEETHDHYYGDWVVVKQPTCTEKGTKQKTCAICDNKITEEIPALGHNYVGGLCSNCGEYNYDSVTLELTADQSSYQLVGIKDKKSTTFVVPSTYNNKPVTSIAKSAFDGYTALTDLTIPSSITTIEADAFENIASGVSVHVSSTANWSEINFGNSKANPLWNGGKLYKNNIIGSTLAQLDGATKIADYSYYGNANFSKADIANSVTRIGKYAFFGTNLQEIRVLPTSITTIDTGAFGNCKELTTITYNGTKEQFLAIEKVAGWADSDAEFNIVCTDGTMSIAEVLQQG